MFVFFPGHSTIYLFTHIHQECELLARSMLATHLRTTDTVLNTNFTLPAEVTVAGITPDI